MDRVKECHGRVSTPSIEPGPNEFRRSTTIHRLPIDSDWQLSVASSSMFSLRRDGTIWQEEGTAHPFHELDASILTALWGVRDSSRKKVVQALTTCYAG
jgi:hypothetical protein